MDKTNEYLHKYNLYLADIHNFTLNIISIKYGNKYVFNELLKELTPYLNNGVVNINKEINFNILKDNPEEILFKNVAIRIENSLYITYKLNNYTFTYSYKIKDGYLENDIIIDFSKINFSGSLRYNDGTEIFIDILRNIKFNDKYINLATNYIIPKIKDKTNCIHLRLEDDAIKSWSEQTKLPFNVYKNKLENKYIDMIKQYINKEELTILLAHNYDNNVIKYLDENKYNYIKTPNMDESRDISAIIDMHIGEYCNNVYIFTFESSYSFTLLTRIKNKE